MNNHFFSNCRIACFEAHGVTIYELFSFLQKSFHFPVWCGELPVCHESDNLLMVHLSHFLIWYHVLVSSQYRFDKSLLTRLVLQVKFVILIWLLNNLMSQHETGLRSSGKSGKHAKVSQGGNSLRCGNEIACFARFKFVATDYLGMFSWLDSARWYIQSVKRSGNECQKIISIAQNLSKNGLEFVSTCLYMYSINSMRTCIGWIQKCWKNEWIYQSLETQWYVATCSTPSFSFFFPYPTWEGENSGVGDRFIHGETKEEVEEEISQNLPPSPPEKSDE